MALKKPKKPLPGRLVDFSGGQNDAVDPDLLNDNESVKLQCATLDQKGTLLPDKGADNRYTTDFDTANPVTGIGSFNKSDGTTRLVMQCGTKLLKDTPHLIKTFDTQADFITGVTKCNIDTDSVPGSVKLCAKPTHSLTRATVAYNEDGTQVASGVPRYKAGKFSNGAWIEEATTNLLTANQSSVETSDYFATTAGATKVWSTEKAFDGTHSIKVTVTAAGKEGIYDGVGYTVTPGLTYTYSCMCLGLSGGEKVRIRLQNQDWTEVALGTAKIMSATKWAQVSVSITVPTGTTTIRPTICNDDTSPSQTWYADGFQLEQKAYATSWQIGDTTRNADQLYYSLSNILPKKNFGCLWWKPDIASANLADREYILASIVNNSGARRYTVRYHKVNGFAFMKDDGSTLYGINQGASPSTFSAGDNIFVGWLDDPASGNMKLWVGINIAPIIERTLSNSVQLTDAQKLYVGCWSGSGYEANGVIDALQIIDVNALEASGTIFDSTFVNNQYTAVSEPTSTPAHLLLANMNDTDGTAATGTLTFTGSVSDTETVTIGTRVYEFDTNSSVTAGNVAVNVSGGATAPAAVTALVNAINGDTSAVVTAVDGAGDTVVVTAKTKGISGNSIVTTETCANASWGGATLTGGIEGIRANELTGGVWISPWQDVGQATDTASGTLSWEQVVPAGTSIAMKTRTSADQVTASAWAAASNGGLIASAHNTYLQIASILSRTDMAQNPELQKVTAAYDGTPSASDLLTGLTAGGNMFMDTLLDTVIIVDGVNTPKKWDGVAVTASDLGGSPPRGEYVAVHKNRVFMLVKSRLYFSDVLNTESWPVLNFIDISPNDGDIGTGLLRNSDYLVITKRRSVHLLVGDSPSNFAVRRLQSNTGCVAPRSLCLVNELVSFTGYDGVYFCDLSSITLASERIKKTWQGLNQRRLTQAASSFHNHVLRIAVPNASSTQNDLVLEYDTIRQAWKTRNDWKVSCWTKFLEAGKEVLLFGHSQKGQVLEIERNYSNNGIGINFEWQSKHFNFGVPERLKRWPKIYVIVKPAITDVPINISFSVDGGVFSTPITKTVPGRSDDKVETILIRPASVGVLRGHSIGFKITQNTPNAAVGIHSLIVPFMVKGARPTI